MIDMEAWAPAWGDGDDAMTTDMTDVATWRKDDDQDHAQIYRRVYGNSRFETLQ